MVCESQFKILDENLIVDPDFSVFVRIARIIPEEEEGIWRLELIHDPSMPANVHKKIAQYSIDGDLKASGDLFPIYSDEFYSFFEFNLVKCTRGDCLVWDIRAVEDNIPAIRFRSLIEGKVYHCDDPKKFLLYVLKNLLLIPGLSEGDWQGQSTVQLTISALQYAFLTESNADADAPPVVLDEKAMGGGK